MRFSLSALAARHGGPLTICVCPSPRWPRARGLGLSPSNETLRAFIPRSTAPFLHGHRFVDGAGEAPGEDDEHHGGDHVAQRPEEEGVRELKRRVRRRKCKHDVRQQRAHRPGQDRPRRNHLLRGTRLAPASPLARSVTEGFFLRSGDARARRCALAEQLVAEPLHGRAVHGQRDVRVLAEGIEGDLRVVAAQESRQLPRLHL
mmetsp:Transcript_10846/g.32969  ORF Transcript_10846/g.32969 Transcript_10846/m.32969 type:complete len:203 (-) Transcript_10846:960-1568(-)